jgi:UDP-N-acetylmuramoyl-L-alanyl-D-glutamate--2,6-diaminopimelate ligase
MSALTDAERVEQAWPAEPGRPPLPRLAALLQGLTYRHEGGPLERAVAGVTADSRRVEPGWAFVAVPGTRHDGHAFAAQAVARGAVALVLERAVDGPLPADVARLYVPDARAALAHLAAAFYGHPSRRLTLIGVTGTNGKTTSTYLLEAMLQALGYAPGVIGTISYRYGGRELTAEQTTPGPEELQRLLRDMVAAGVSHCAMEVSSHALAQQRVAGCRFAAALFTNLSQDHLDFHGDMQAYYAAKARLFTEYRPGLAVVNGDDAAGQALVQEACAPVLTYGFSPQADAAVEDLHMDAQGIRLQARVQGRRVAIRSPLVGRHNVYNLLGALGVAAGLGWDLERAIGGLETVAAVPGRFERVDAGQPFAVLVDYAHTPDALRNALTAARALTSGRLIAVFGAGGDRDRSKRPAMGRVAAEHADVAVITSDNPRSEEPMAIIRAIEAGYRAAAPTGHCQVIEDRACAIRQAIALARAGDVVVIAGKGHETYQIIGAERHPFDDRHVARQALRALGFGEGRQ